MSKATEELIKHAETVLAELIRHAPFEKGIKDLCKKLGYSRATVYRYFDLYPRLKDELYILLGSQVDDPKTQLKSKRTQKVNEQIEKELKDRFKGVQVDLDKLAEKDREERAPKLQPVLLGEKLAKGMEICELIKDGLTTREACNKVGVAYELFYRWTRPESNQYMETIALEFKEARLHFDEFITDELDMLSKKMAVSLLTIHEQVTTTKSGIVDKKGQIKASHVKHVSKKVHPNIATAKFILEKIASGKFGTPEERASEREKPQGLDYQHRHKTLAQLEQEEAELKKELGIIDEEENG